MVSLPQEAELITEQTDNDIYELRARRSHVQAFNVVDGRITVIRVYHASYNFNQNFTIHLSFSNIPYGPSIVEIPISFSNFALIEQETYFAFYPISLDTIETMSKWDEDCFDDCFDLKCEITKPRKYENALTIRMPNNGTYYANFRNLANKQNSYFYEAYQDLFPHISDC